MMADGDTGAVLKVFELAVERGLSCGEIEVRQALAS